MDDEDARENGTAEMLPCGFAFAALFTSGSFTVVGSMLLEPLRPARAAEAAPMPVSVSDTE